MKLSFVSAHSQNSVVFSPTQSYAVQSFSNTMKSADTNPPTNNQQRLQLKGANNYISFGKDQFNSPLSLKQENEKSPTLSNKNLLFQSPNQLTSLSTATGRDLVKYPNTSFTRSPKQVTFSDEGGANQRVKQNQEIVNPYNLREARLKQQQQLQSQSSNEKIYIEEDLDNYQNKKSGLTLIPKQAQQQFQNENEQENINSNNLAQFSLRQDNGLIQQDGKLQNQPSYYLTHNKLGERSVIKEETEEDSDYKVKNSFQQSGLYDQNNSQIEQLRQNCMNQEYLEFKNQQQSLFKLPTAEEEAERQERIKNVVVENKKISAIKNSIKNRLAELERKIEDVNKNDGQVHQELNKIDHHLMQESASELDDASNNNSKSIRSFSQNKDLDSNKITPRISNNEDYLKQSQLPYQKTIKYENLNQNSNSAIQNCNNKTLKKDQNSQGQSPFSSKQNLSRGESYEGINTLSKYKYNQENAIPAHELDQYKIKENNNPIRSRDNLGNSSRDEQSNISALVRDFSNIADNKRVNDSSYQNQQQSFSIATEYKKQYLPLSESITPSQQLPDSLEDIPQNNIRQQLLPHHNHNFSFRDRAAIESERKNGRNEKKNKDDEFRNQYVNIQQKINEFNQREQLNQSSSQDQSIEKIRQSQPSADYQKYNLPHQIRINDDKQSDYKREELTKDFRRRDLSNEMSRKEYLKSQSQSQISMNRQELDCSNHSRNASLNKSSSELKYMLNEDLNRSLNKHKQLNQIKDKITDELLKQKQKKSQSKTGNAKILDNLLQNNKTQAYNYTRNYQTIPNEELAYKIKNSNITENTQVIVNNSTNRSNRSDILNRSNLNQSDRNNNSINNIKEDYYYKTTAIPPISQSNGILNKSQTQKVITPSSQRSAQQSQAPLSSSRNNLNQALPNTQQQNQYNHNLNNNSNEMKATSQRSSFNMQNIADRLDVGNKSVDKNNLDIADKSTSNYKSYQDYYEKPILDQSSSNNNNKSIQVKEKINNDLNKEISLQNQKEKSEQDYKENKFYNAVKNQIKENNSITNKQISDAIKEAQKPLQENNQIIQKAENSAILSKADKSYLSNEASFSKSKSRLQVRSLAEFQMDNSQNNRHLEKEQDIYKKKINEIKRDIDEKEAQVKLQKKITECINIYQNERRNEQSFQVSRQRSPMQTQSNLFSSSLISNLPNQYRGGVSGLNQTDLEIPSQVDQNKMLNLSMSVSFASPSQRSASKSKKSVRFLNPQEDKELLNGIENAKKSQCQEKIKKIISQKVHTWLNKPSLPLNRQELSKQEQNKQLNSSINSKSKNILTTYNRNKK